ncbi:hypothetical protein [Mycobacterium sp.]|uniref:hypothetical protein n=1 Tax=Mycobacterium sp. TaxID=1785 RepID=UPI002C637C28|nr:hypothetical protein [Mycobacterium sp.]HTH90905.1 hypothetical protein [Mycobacterium sp.]
MSLVNLRCISTAIAAGGVGLVSAGPVTAIVTACAVATALHRIIAQSRPPLWSSCRPTLFSSEDTTATGGSDDP